MLGASNVKFVITYSGFHKWRIRTLCQLCNALVHHLGSYIQCVMIDIIIETVALLMGKNVMLTENHRHGIRLLLIARHADNGLLIVGNFIINTFGRIFRRSNRAENVLDLLFHDIHIDVTYHYDALQVGTVPFMIIVTQEL